MQYLALGLITTSNLFGIAASQSISSAQSFPSSSHNPSSASEDVPVFTPFVSITTSTRTITVSATPTSIYIPINTTVPTIAIPNKTVPVPSLFHESIIGLEAGFGVGIARGIILSIPPVLFSARRRIHSTYLGPETATVKILRRNAFISKVELDNGYVFPPEAFVWEEAIEKAELITKANTHDLEGKSVSGTQSNVQMSTEMEEVFERQNMLDPGPAVQPVDFV